MLKSFTVAAAIAGVLATAPPASAASSQAGYGIWPPGNCAQGTFCGWANTDHPPQGPTAPPSLVATADWSGNVTIFNFYNYTSRNVDITWTAVWSGTVYTGTLCATSGDGHLYVPVTVTKVAFHTRNCF